ncbi:hypothetical protein [Streptomyces sp. WAC05858]|uniref:hypothetical protein n=1 Tax=Streptomyces TaxID=1883 RepID=UPI00163C5695|nr:hypothetical protein [Streptomyces sp. WAC05858]
MLTMISKSGEVDRHPKDALLKLAESLSDEYQPVVGPLASRQAELFGIQAKRLQGTPSDVFRRPSYQSDEAVVSAEIFTKGDTLIVIRLVEYGRQRPVRNEEGKLERREEVIRLVAVSYAAPKIDKEVTAEFELHVKKIWGVELRERVTSPRKLEENAPLGRGGKAEVASVEDVRGAKALSDKSSRALAVSIKSSRGLLLSDAPKQIPPKDKGRLNEIVRSLIEAGIVETEIVVICSSTSSQVNKIPSVEVLQEMDRRNVRCSCGNYLSAERTEEALNITEHGKFMLDGSRWLSVLVLQGLIDLGVPIENIRMEQEYAGEEVDCMAEIYGKLVLFELKDKQFNLGNAYSFGAKVGIFRPDYPVIVTTEKVGSDARRHFMQSAQSGKRRMYYSKSDRSGAEGMVFIEGMGNLQEGLEGLVSSIAIEAFSPHVQSALSFSMASPGAILSAWAGKER